MNILFLSSPHPYKTAGSIIYDICNGFIKRGYQTKLMVKAYDSYNKEWIINYHSKFSFIKYKFFKKIKQKTIKYRYKIDDDYRIQTFNQRKKLLNINKVKKKIKFNPDGIVIYFAQQFINFIDIYNLYKEYGVPVFIIVPDMAYFTGICHYSWNCEGYKNQCGYCPAISSTKKTDVSFNNLKSKLDVKDKIELHAMTVSDWLLTRMRQSALFHDKSLYKIPTTTTRKDFFSLETEERKELRKKYDIDENTFVLSFGSLNLTHKRKGIHHIVDALNQISVEFLDKKNAIILYAGGGDLPKSLHYKKAKHLGQLGWEKLVEFYQISDLYISASIQDTGPGSIIESMLCGTPVISYDTGVAKDWILPGVTGYLAKTENIEDLKNKISLILDIDKKDYQNMRAKCSNYSHQKNDPEKLINTIEDIVTNFIKPHSNV